MQSMGSRPKLLLAFSRTYITLDNFIRLRALRILQIQRKWKVSEFVLLCEHSVAFRHSEGDLKRKIGTLGEDDNHIKVSGLMISSVLTDLH
jgi:hypothetical protein